MLFRKMNKKQILTYVIAALVLLNIFYYGLSYVQHRAYENGYEYGYRTGYYDRGTEILDMFGFEDNNNTLNSQEGIIEIPDWTEWEK